MILMGMTDAMLETNPRIPQVTDLLFLEKDMFRHPTVKNTTIITMTINGTNSIVEPSCKPGDDGVVASYFRTD